ncbi:hypothetical protein G6045_25265 [Streptomyces sp. YC504]|uniref:STAS domain-containing protein n=1 Tax=Streptomyces mesophilus TaxID=1775132 RepID=A0A6G4XQG3_9ACTN|nr:hypothetical protein [Streptomyces mesophilus]NGO78944.1 hypothetical protein [Streptomyces mesophilus]
MDAPSLNGSMPVKVDPDTATVWLYGHATGARKAAVTQHLATLLGHGRDDIVVDLSGAAGLSNSLVDVFVAIACLMEPPRRLILRAPASLALPRRLTTRSRRPHSLASTLIVQEQ